MKNSPELFFPELFLKTLNVVLRLCVKQNFTQRFFSRPVIRYITAMYAHLLETWKYTKQKGFKMFQLMQHFPQR